MAFDSKYSDFGGTDPEWTELWKLVENDTSRWRTYITPENCKLARDSFIKNKAHMKVQDQVTFDHDTRNVKGPGVDGNISGVTDKIGSANKDRNGNPIPHIDLRAEKIAFGQPATYMFYALHELVHWLSFPPNQGAASHIRLFLGSGLTEGLVSIVTDDMMRAKKLIMTMPPNASVSTATLRDKDTASYTAIMPIVAEMINHLGVAAFGHSLFGASQAVGTAMRAKWRLGSSADDFKKLIGPLWKAADKGDTSTATKYLHELMQRDKIVFQLQGQGGTRLK